MIEVNHYEQQLAELHQHIYGLPQTQKQTLLMKVFTGLHQHHVQHCLPYRRFADASTPINAEQGLASLPYINVRMFKNMALKSIAEDDVFKVLQSSGTTGQTPARIFLDRDTSSRQSKALVTIMQSYLGKQRLPMLIIDSPAVLKDRRLSARVAGIQGMMFFGRKPVFALNDDMSLNRHAMKQFASEHANQPVLLFGFTFMVWLYFVKAMRDTGLSINLPHGLLVHSGGWKKVTAEQVDNATFKQVVKQVSGISRVHNFYGMAEQVGSVYVECEAGHLHTPANADVIIRDPLTLNPQPIGKQGLIQVLSALPTSYPGFSLLTEDLGTVLGEDDCQCGRLGKYFMVAGRVPKAEVRGCSDTFS